MCLQIILQTDHTRELVVNDAETHTIHSLVYPVVYNSALFM